MPFPSSLSWTGLGKETVRGTAVPPAFFLPASGPDFEPMLTLLEDKGYRGDMNDVQDLVAGLRHDEFSFGGSVYVDTFPTLLQMALGSTDAITGAGPYTHVIGLLNNAAQGQPPSYTITDFDGNVQRQFPAGQLDNLALKFIASGLLSYTTRALSNAFAVVGATTPTFTGEEAVPGWDFTVTLGGVGQVNVMEGDLTLARGTKPIEAATGTQAPYRLWAGPLNVGGKLTVVYETANTELASFLAATAVSLDYKWVNPAVPAESLVLHGTTVKLKAAKPAVRGKEWIEQEYQTVWLPNTTDAVAGGRSPIKTTTINAVSTAY
jgi:hypothetical protein